MVETIIKKRGNYTLTWHKRGGIHTNKGLFIDAPKRFFKSIMRRKQSSKTTGPRKRSRISRRPKRPKRKKAAVIKQELFSPKNVGYTPTSKKLIKSSAVCDVSSAMIIRTLTWACSNFQVTGIGPATGPSDEPYKREKNQIFFKGVTYELMIANQHFNAVTLNYALLAPVDRNATSISAADFFRSRVDGPDGRGHDFGVAYANSDFAFNPINTDHHTVLLHHRALINGWNNSGLATTTSGKNYRIIRGYKKINREIRFDDNACTSPIFWVMWFDDFCAVGGTAATTYGSGLPSVNLRLFNHWQEM